MENFFKMYVKQSLKFPNLEQPLTLTFIDQQAARARI